MASGHANRANRPNTWPQPTQSCDVKILLANSEPSTHGTFRNSRDVRLESGMRTKADVRRPLRFMMGWTPRRRHQCAKVEVLSTT